MSACWELRCHHWMTRLDRLITSNWICLAIARLMEGLPPVAPTLSPAHPQILIHHPTRLQPEIIISVDDIIDEKI